MLSTSKKLEDAVRNNPLATVIYQIFDSSIYFASSAPGEQVLPRRGANGKHHAPGELVLADWATFRKIFYVAIPLLRAGGENKKIILSPLPRYSTSKCCSEERHITNFGTKGYGTAWARPWLTSTAEPTILLEARELRTSKSPALAQQSGKTALPPRRTWPRTGDRTQSI